MNKLDKVIEKVFYILFLILYVLKYIVAWNIANIKKIRWIIKIKTITTKIYQY
jgi:hypothetical protein